MYTLKNVTLKTFENEASYFGWIEFVHSLALPNKSTFRDKLMAYQPDVVTREDGSDVERAVPSKLPDGQVRLSLTVVETYPNQKALVAKLSWMMRMGTIEPLEAAELLHLRDVNKEVRDVFAHTKVHMTVTEG